jgi:hypothetical protein
MRGELRSRRAFAYEGQLTACGLKRLGRWGRARGRKKPRGGREELEGDSCSGLKGQRPSHRSGHGCNGIEAGSGDGRSGKRSLRSSKNVASEAGR